MLCLWNKVAGAIFIIILTRPLTECSCDWRLPYFPVYYSEVHRFSIDFSVYSVVNRTWSKDGKPLHIGNCTKHNDPSCTEPIYSINRANHVNLNFKKITLNDSGKYTLELFCLNGGRRVNSFEIIVQKNPFVYSDCKDMSVYEGENVTCVCKTRGYASSVLRWTPFNSKKVQKDILILQNVSQNESGVYTCVAKSRNFVSKTSFRLTVFPKITSVQIEYFKVFREIRLGNNKILLVCRASRISEAMYTIFHQKIVLKHGNMVTVDLNKESALGPYECLVRNNGGTSDRRVLFLNSSFLVKQCLIGQKKTESELKEFLIIGVGSFITGILALAFWLCCCKKCNTNKNKKSHHECYDDVCPRIDKKIARADNVELRTRYSSRWHGNKDSRDNVEYDVREHGNDDSTYYNETNLGRFNKYRNEDVGSYKLEQRIYENC